MTPRGQGAPERTRLSYLILFSFVFVSVGLAIVSTLVYKPGETMHLSLRTDALKVVTADRLYLDTQARRVELDGVASLRVSGATKTLANEDGDGSYVIMDAPTKPKGQVVPPAGVDFRFDDARSVELLRRKEASGQPQYVITRERARTTSASTGGSSEVIITVQPGQQVRKGDQVIFPTSGDGGAGGQVTVIGGRTLRVTLSAVQPDSSGLLPAHIVGVEFDRPQSSPSPETPSAILSGELSFLTLIDKPITLRQGTDLSLRSIDATLQSVALAEDGVVANIVGEVDRARLHFGHRSRDIQPTWFDYLLSSRAGRALVGTFAFVVGVLSNLRSLLGSDKAGSKAAGAGKT